MDQAAMAAFLRGLLPRTWFPDEAPVLDGILFGIAGTMTWAFGLLSFVRAQGRIATASGLFLDIAAYDYLGNRIRRRDGEADAFFRLRLLRQILRPKTTRQSVSDALFDLTGHRPLIFEPGRPADTGGWDTPAFAFNAAGGWGSRRLPYQAFLTGYRVTGGGPPHISGFDNAPGSWGPGSFAMQSPAALLMNISDQNMDEAIASTISANTVVWRRYRPPVESTEGIAAGLDIDFQLDVSALD